MLSITHASYCKSDPALQGPAVCRETNIPTKSTDLLKGEGLRVGVRRGGCVGQGRGTLQEAEAAWACHLCKGDVIRNQQKGELVTDIYSPWSLEARNQC